MYIVDKCDTYEEVTSPYVAYGMQLEIPEWAKYLAIDEDGEIFCFNQKPSTTLADAESFGGIWDADKGENVILGRVALEDTDWKETLLEITRNAK